MGILYQFCACCGYLIVIGDSFSLFGKLLSVEESSRNMIMFAFSLPAFALCFLRKMSQLAIFTPLGVAALAIVGTVVLSDYVLAASGYKGEVLAADARSSPVASEAGLISALSSA